MTVLNTNKGTQIGLLISYYLTLSFWSAQTLSLSLISRNIAGQTKKTTVIAANFIAWATGNAIGKPDFPPPPSPLRAIANTNPSPPLPGPQVFLKWDSPRYLIAFSTHLGCYTLLVLVIIFLRFHLMRQNKKKDELASAGIKEANDAELVHAFDDLTDRQNLNFRYMY
jgi:hypothetical protein